MNSVRNNSQRVVSGIMPGKGVTLGSYLTRVTQWVNLQQEDHYSALYGIMDLHAMTQSTYDPATLRLQTNQLALELAASGLDLKKSTVFVQSLVPEHTELAWILACVAPYDRLVKMLNFQSQSKPSANHLSKPILQAADILLYQASLVPVGIDQGDNLTFTQELAHAFNERFQNYFPIPKPLYALKELAFLNDSVIWELSAFAEEEEIMNLAKGKKFYEQEEETGSLNERVANWLLILKHIGYETASQKLRKTAEAGNLVEQQLVETIQEALLKLTSNLRKRKNELHSEQSFLGDKMRENSQVARQIARKSLNDVRLIVGMKSTHTF